MNFQISDHEIETRTSRIRAAMFPDWTPPTSAAEATNSSSSIVELMHMPTQQLKQSVMDLLTYEGSNDMSGMSLPDLVKLMCDHDESVVARAVHRAYMLSREDPNFFNTPGFDHRAFIEALMHASK